MSNQADIRDIQVLGDLKAAFGRFGEELQQILPALQKQFEEIQEQLDDRQKHWRQQSDDAKEVLYAARQSLNECESQGEDEDGNSPDCSFEQEQVTDAERTLAENEDNLETVKQWRHRIEDQIADFQNDVHRLSNLASSRTGSAQAFLANKIEILNNYIGGVSSTLASSGLQKQGGNDKIRFGSELTSAERQALHRYTGSEFEEINKTLRKGLSNDVALRLAELISQAIVKLPAYRGTVYRGATLPADEISKYIPGHIITEKQFISSSTRREISEQFGKDDPRVIFIIKSKKGRAIAGASDYALESEVLFDKGTQFKVLSRDIINGVWQITEEEL